MFSVKRFGAIIVFALALALPFVAEPTYAASSKCTGFIASLSVVKGRFSKQINEILRLSGHKQEFVRAEKLINSEKFKNPEVRRKMRGIYERYFFSYGATGLMVGTLAWVTSSDVVRGLLRVHNIFTEHMSDFAVGLPLWLALDLVGKSIFPGMRNEILFASGSLGLISTALIETSWGVSLLGRPGPTDWGDLTSGTLGVLAYVIIAKVLDAKADGELSSTYDALTSQEERAVLK